MRIELLLVGTKLFSKNRFFLNCKDISTTRLELPRGRKIIVFELLDQLGKTIPLSYGIIAVSHLVATNLAFKEPSDQANYENDSFRGRIHMLATVFDSDTFISHGEKIKQLNAKLEEEIRRYTKLLEEKDRENEKRIKSIQEPYEKILAQKNQKIQELSSSQMIATLKFEDKLIILIERSIDMDLRETLGMGKDELKREADNLTNTSLDETK